MEIDRVARAGDVVGYRRYLPCFPIRDIRTGELEGASCNFGRRGANGSGRYTRIYDKGLESHGLNNCIRCEVEFSGDYAKGWFEILTDCFDLADFKRHIARAVGGAIDFRDRQQHKELDRMERFAWWQAFVDALGACVLSIERKTPPLQVAMSHHDHQWCGKIATLYERAELFGFDGDAICAAYMRNMVCKGREKPLHVRPAVGEQFDLTTIIGEDAYKYLKEEVPF
jgi:hypothetical protein